MLAGIVGLFVYTHSSIVGALAEVPRATPCPKVGNETTCSCDVQEGRTGEKLFSAALSREANALEVDCQRDLICAPKGLEKSTVCSAEASNWTACDLDLNKLLANNTAQVTWTECAKKDKIAEGQCKTLSIPRENFPYADEQFTVGCTQGEITKCKVTVSVTARPSVTEGDTVTCAYGASSNPSHQAVTLSPSKNSFTLVCGEKGTVLPTNYQTSFCSPGSEDAKKSCEGDYQTILPGYEGNWWHSDSNANTFTLSIPADKFPTEEAKIMVGCHQKQQLSAEQKSAQGASSPTLVPWPWRTPRELNPALGMRRHSVRLPETSFLEGHAEALGCVASESETVCTCDNKTQLTTPLVASLSDKRNVLNLECRDGLHYAPDGLSRKKVCDANSSTLKCGEDNGPPCMDIDDLLAGSPTNVQWTEVKKKATGQPKSLTIPPENIPYIDGHFVVGCLDSASNETPKCKVAVTVEARASLTDGQTVTCAYGASSNPSHQAVTLSPSKNSFTLVCGEKGTVLPTNYQTSFCSPGSEDAKKSCEGDYQTILPGYEGKWWEKREGAESYTLSIPVDKFPKEQARIVVGCEQKDERANVKNTAPSGKGPTVCSVDVTIEAGASASPSSLPASADAVLSGAAALVGLIRS
ncbi:SAG-related sequence [Besnoitia besnoiti]|uniref:SAG-related sequence n=1 Tax=Besnoitia besnoiti TaxID=94643 RepID=A0A2A9MJE1_BESBE|nr:SAG-related sequence [Besnoitia besnoiti]PFH36086.1 SAG-related sequence [Besnoitia besnoiti]